MVSSILISSLLLSVLRKDDFLSIFFVIILLLGSLIQVVMLLKTILRKNSELEITENKININHIEVPIQKNREDYNTRLFCTEYRYQAIWKKISFNGFTF
ncbi:hypothetical protein PNBC_16575 [Paenibacillus crassostreae]|uniref:Uncharacterized protein n=1 Tax=Paenibacillus crassostreae TaxID=1763538 RepID=A0A162RJY3_9BACL|nr:hypothetical protein LPB68_10130 [Paenibacillus crassostreae]OAB72507.1 hypothetical protein PNBC_16575 [Paenibacillus crassostreae]